MNEMERRIIRKLLEMLIEAGYSLSVWDGESYAIMNSRNVDDTLTEMGHTGEDNLQVSMPDANDPYGDDGHTITLIYGNDGHDVIADYVMLRTLPSIQDILDQVEAFANDLAAEATP